MVDDLGETMDVADRSMRGPRSPSYPSIPLSAAIDRAKELRVYQPAKKPIPVDVALKVWKYGRKSGAGLQQLAALIKYGLLEQSGSMDQRIVKLSDLAWKILLDERLHSPDRDAAIREAATKPKINAEIRERYPHGLPDDETVGFWLSAEKAFNPKAIPSFLADLRSTFEFAKLDLEPENDHNGIVKVGDFIQWTSQGRAMWKSPLKVVRIDEKDGDKFAAVIGEDGQEGWVPVNQVTVQKPPEGAGRPQPLAFKPPLVGRREEDTGDGIKQEVAAIGKGRATVEWPITRTPEEYDDLEYWLKGVLRKARRDVGADANPSPDDGEKD